MRKNIYENKKYITQITQKYIYFKFSDGKQSRIKPTKTDLKELHEWLKSEMQFYQRMYEELHNSYEKQKEQFDKTKHYYSEEEIYLACKKNRFADIDMKIKNKEYEREWKCIAGIGKEANKINDKYWKYYNLAEQIKTVYTNFI